MTTMSDLGMLRYREDVRVVEVVEATEETIRAGRISIDLDTGTWTDSDSVTRMIGKCRPPRVCSDGDVIGVYDRIDWDQLGAMVVDSRDVPDVRTSYR